MLKRLSSKLIAIFALMFLGLTATTISSYIASDTQKQHLIFTELVSEVKLLTERAAYITENISDLAYTNSQLFKEKLEQEEGNIKIFVDKVDYILSAFRTRQLQKDNKIIKLKFRGEFLEILNSSLINTDLSWNSAKEHIFYLNNINNINDIKNYQLKRDNFKKINKDMIKNSDYLVKICMEESEKKRVISNAIQITSIIVALIIFFLMMILITESFYKPILEIKTVFTSMANGQIDQKFTRKQNDEFGELYGNFNKFIENLNFIFALEDQIISKNQIDSILIYISENIKYFIPFTKIGIVYSDDNNVVYMREVKNGEIIKAELEDSLKKYREITVEGNKIVVPMVANEAYIGYTFLDLEHGADVKTAHLNFLELIKGETAIAFYKSILFKNLLSIVTEALAKMAEKRDPETGYHLIRMSTYSQIIANKLRENGRYTETIDQEFIENIKITAPMHDIGKVAIPDNILLKPGKLTDDEFEIMKTHAQIGGEVLEGIDNKFKRYNINYFKMAADIANGHQEKYDGKGYPKGIKGESIPLSARITALADVFDALTSKRPYKEAFSLEKSYDIIKKSYGSHFEPKIVDAFFDAIEEIESVYEKYKEV
ncbi:MAG: HD domain-containing protein [Desulfamplus sp.]|nr:HD domain-containing protein [Desulfamplus sp.]